MTLFLLIISLLLELGLLVLAINWIWHCLHITEGPFIYSRPHMIKWVAENIKVGDGEKFCELGCGGAEILARLAKRHPKATFVGLEKNIVPFTVAKIRTAGLKNVTIKKINIYQENWGQFDWFYSFLLTAQMVHVEKKFIDEAKPSAIFLSYIFPCPTLKPFKTDIRHKEALYYYHPA